MIKEVGGIKVGIIGLVTPETAYKSHPLQVQGLTFEDPVQTSTNIIAEIKDQVDVIVALGHLGIIEDYKDTSIKVAEEVSGIDLFVDGHSHSVLEEGILVKDTLITSTGEYGKNLGVVTLKIKDGKVVQKEAQLTSKEGLVEQVADQEMMKLIDELDIAGEAVLKEVVGKTKVHLDGEREHVRTRETNLGNLMADIMREASAADIAMMNGGNIRASIAAGHRY